ncbi:hypothetical protein LEMLEM_LOCUS13628, partial [Lemmus lemmus]
MVAPWNKMWQPVTGGAGFCEGAARRETRPHLEHVALIRERAFTEWQLERRQETWKHPEMQKRRRTRLLSFCASVTGE